MSHGLLSAPLPFDVGLGSLLLANMLSAWLDNEVVAQGNREAAHEPSQDHGASPGSVRLCLPPPVHPGPSASPSGKHGTTVCFAGEGAGTGLERSFDPHSRPRPGQVGSADGRSGGLQDLGGRCLDGTSGRGVCLGSLSTLALRPRLASAAGVVCPHPDSGH